VLFKLADNDSNGVISEKELKILLQDKMQIVETEEEF